MKMHHTFRRAALVLWACLCTLASIVPALELSDIHLPMTRDEADATLSKDYTFSVMTDGSVRRTWELDGKRVVIDFDTVSNNAIMAAIIYERPVSKKKGIEDAHTIAAGKYDEKATWDAPKDKEAKELIANTYGLKNARRKKLDDKAMLFYETNDQKSRIVRVSLFASMPHTNRWALSTLTKNSTKTAMGNQMGGSFITELYKDEERRQTTIPLKTEETPTETEETPVVLPTITITKTTPAPKPEATTPKPETPQPLTIVKKEQPEPTPASTTSGTPTPKATTTTTTGKRLAPGERATMSLLLDAPDWLKSVGIEEPTWWHYIGLALILILLAIFGIRAMSQGSSRAAQRRRFANVVSQTPAPGGTKIRKR